MAKFNVTGMVEAPVSLEIEAESADEAITKLYEMRGWELLHSIIEDGVEVTDGTAYAERER